MNATDTARVHTMVTDLHLKNTGMQVSIILIVYFSLSLYLLFVNGFKYVIDPDVTSYISIAQKYMAGDFSNAVNAHWSPLASWLAIPLLVMKIRPLLAFALSAAIVGGFTLLALYLLLSAIEVKDSIRFFYALALSPLIAWYALTEGNPDLLCLCILIFYVYVMTREDFKTSTYGGIVAGLLGGAAYLSKSYNFYFFLLHFIGSILLYWYGSAGRSQRKIILINGLSGLLVFMVISSIWIGLLTAKYHEITISTAGDYNLSFTRPGSPGHMVDTQGLLPPPNDSAFSAWEDPTSIKKVPWSPLASISDFQYFVKNTAKNATLYLLYISKNHIIFFTLIYFIIISITFRLRDINKVYYLFLTTILHPVGYFMLLAEDRYFWIDYILLYVISAYVLDDILQKTKFISLQKIILSSIIFLYIAILPLIYIRGAEGSINHFKEIYFLSKEINKYHNFRNVNIASQIANWCDDLYLSYYLRSRYYGKVKENITDDQLKRKLIEYNIQYYFVHGTLKNSLDILQPDKKFGDITIYKVVATASLPGGVSDQTS